MVHSRHGWPLPPPGAGAAGSPLRQAAVPRAMVLPRTLMPSERRGWRGPGAFPNAGPALALWSAQPGTIHSTAVGDGHRRPAVSHAPGEEVETRSESRSERGECGPMPVGLATRRQTPRPADLPAGGDAAASEGVEAAASHRLRGDGLSGGFVRRRPGRPAAGRFSQPDTESAVQPGGLPSLNR